MKRAWVVFGTLTVLIIAAGTIWWWLAGFSAQPSDAEDPNDMLASEGPIDEAASAATALEDLEHEPGNLLPAELHEEFSDQLTQAIPPGTRVEPDESTWIPSDVGGGTMQMMVKYPDGVEEKLIVVMDQEQGQWKVLQTIQVTDAP